MSQVTRAQAPPVSGREKKGKGREKRTVAGPAAAHVAGPRVGLHGWLGRGGLFLIFF